MDQSMLAWAKTSPFNGGSASYLEDLYEQYLNDPTAVPENWRKVFEQIHDQAQNEIPHSAIKNYFREIARTRVAASHQIVSVDLKQIGVLSLVNAYRKHGHRVAQIDPLGLREPEHVEALQLGYHDLSEVDLEREFFVDIHQPAKKEKLGKIIERFRRIYCGSVGWEYLHVEADDERRWLQGWIENRYGQEGLSAEQKKEVLYLLTAAEGLEKYLGAKFPGAKRFGLEGGESLIPLLNELIQNAGARGSKEVVMGMAHRGRLNTLVNILGKTPKELMEEFEGNYQIDDEDYSGDVKYHQGFSADVKTPGGVVHLALAFNPSHLEIVAPVVEGSVRARQERRFDEQRKLVVPIVMHGDAAFTGQGVVMETFNMSQTRAYKTGGTIHIVINNQVGFTTSRPDDARSTRYCTDVAKMIAAPIFHVNGDDPEAVIRVARLALDYRMTFGKDVVIDLVCYRRLGHNEADEPRATQPIMYQVIRKHPPVRKLYAEQLQKEKVIEASDAKRLADHYRELLELGKNVVPTWIPMQTHEFTVDWRPYLNAEWTDPADTTLSAEVVKRLGDVLTTVPENFVLQSRVQKIIEDRRAMYAGEKPLDWGAAENLAYAGLVYEGHRVRITGQDSGRGTFFHRHAVWHDQNTGETYIPLKHIAQDQGPFDIYDSVLSEEAVLAFEYGYATTEPRALVIWEAQFGDFANGAQVVIDQFISSGENKWGRLCGLTLLLPHGYEGQGPEHSSARLERFLQLCAQHNMQICIPSTPAQAFHMLRRQVLRPLRKPLIVMSPKSLLRHKLAVSSLEDITNGHFHTVIPEIDDLVPERVRRVVLCSGKVYYDVLQKRRDEGIDDIAIVRIEQLYPFPLDELQTVLAPYAHVKDFVWCQEEPMNQGAWYCSQHNFRAAIPEGATLGFAGRPPSAAPATGVPALHEKEQKALVAQALNLSISD
ncbi:MAG: 2-oxoglutarate dehydrogenase E1 component [Gammaproteobacteria bacterium]|nr:MAG: 2-oxoglutarate dehydrogenase E1 component [Gammaproteobacteria bacterium]